MLAEKLQTARVCVVYQHKIVSIAKSVSLQFLSNYL